VIDIPPEIDADLTPWERAIWGAESLAPRILRALTTHTALTGLAQEEAASVRDLGAPPYWEVAHWAARWETLSLKTQGDA